MERDLQIHRLIRESGIVPAPDRFTGNVMNKIGTVSERKTYKPIIGRAGRILIILSIISILAISVFYSEPASAFTLFQLQMPEWNFNLQFLSEVKISTGLVSALVAIFILVLSDAGLSRRRLV